MSFYFCTFAARFSSRRTKNRYNKIDASAARDNFLGAPLETHKVRKPLIRAFGRPLPRRLTYQCGCDSVAVGERCRQGGAEAPDETLASPVASGSEPKKHIHSETCVKIVSYIEA